MAICGACAASLVPSHCCATRHLTHIFYVILLCTDIAAVLWYRFDLLHVMIDDTTEATDERIARHIIGVHRFQQGAFADVPYTTEQIQRWVELGRSNCKAVCVHVVFVLKKTTARQQWSSWLFCVLTVQYWHIT